MIVGKIYLEEIVQGEELKKLINTERMIYIKNMILEKEEKEEQKEEDN
jgi:hypothetical protein